jgi:hypothetical protein
MTLLPTAGDHHGGWPDGRRPTRFPQLAFSDRVVRDGVRAAAIALLLLVQRLKFEFMPLRTGTGR